jgi:hypothetical protein
MRRGKNCLPAKMSGEYVTSIKGGLQHLPTAATP